MENLFKKNPNINNYFYFIFFFFILIFQSCSSYKYRNTDELKYLIHFQKGFKNDIGTIKFNGKEICKNIELNSSIELEKTSFSMKITNRYIYFFEGGKIIRKKNYENLSIISVKINDDTFEDFQIDDEKGKYIAIYKDKNKLKILQKNTPFVYD